MFCGHCGREAESGHRFCTGCGSPLPGDRTPDRDDPVSCPGTSHTRRIATPPDTGTADMDGTDVPDAVQVPDAEPEEPESGPGPEPIQDDGGITRVENSLPLASTIDDQSIIHIKNQDNISIRKRRLAFLPVYVTDFVLHEEFVSPDKKQHVHEAAGSYHVDALTGELIFGQYDSGSVFKLSDEEHLISDLQEFEPGTVEVEYDAADSDVVRFDPQLDVKTAAARVKTQVARDSRAMIEYKVKVGRNKYDTKKYPHMPDHESIACTTHLVLVPRLDIEFASGEHTYHRTVLMASGIVTTDEISVCDHRLGNKTTFAVCDVCGIAKCEKDIILGDHDDCYCKAHAPEDIRPESHGSYLSKGLQKIRLKRR